MNLTINILLFANYFLYSDNLRQHVVSHQPRFNKICQIRRYLIKVLYILDSNPIIFVFSWPSPVWPQSSNEGFPEMDRWFPNL